MMKKIDRLALIAIVLIIISRIASVFSKNLLTLLYGANRGMNISLLDSVSAATMLPFILLINIGIGVWLYREAKKDESSPWVWCLFGFLFGLMGVAVFYLIRIYSLLKDKEKSIGEPPDTGYRSEDAPQPDP